MVHDFKAQPLAVVVLAGGTSERLGLDKRFMTLGKKQLLEIVLENVMPLANEVAIVARHKEQKPAAHESLPNVEWLTDEHKGLGPLEGARVGMNWMLDRGYQMALLVGCDYPFLHSAAIEILAMAKSDHQAVCFSHQSVRNPFPGIYDTDLGVVAEQLLVDRKRSLQSLLDRVDAKLVDSSILQSVDPQLSTLLNINDRETLEIAQNRLAR